MSETLRVVNGTEQLVDPILTYLETAYAIPREHVRGVTLTARVGDVPTMTVTLIPRLEPMPDAVAWVPLVGETRPEQPRTALRAVPPVWRPGDGPTGSGDDDLRAASLERAGEAWRATVAPCEIEWQDLGSGPGVAVCTTHRRAAVLCGARPVPQGEPEPRMAPHTLDFEDAVLHGCTCTWEQTIDDPRPRLVSVAVDCPL